MSTISLQAVESTSATKSQKNNASILFGRTGDKVLIALETLTKTKEIDTGNLNHILEVLKDEVSTHRYAGLAVGKKNILALKNLSVQKSLIDCLAIVSKVKVPKAFA